MQKYLIRTSHRPRPLPPGRWVMTQRWNDLLFAHWPVSPAAIAPLLPEGLEVDTFQGSAWLGVVPFWLDRIKVRGVPPIPGARSFPDLNLRTYVRDRYTGTPGVYFFSLDSSNLLAVVAAHVFFHLPYHWAEMRLEQRSEREFSFYSRRRFSSQPVIFKARYRGLGPQRKLAEGRPGSLEYFLMERSCLFSRNRAGKPIAPICTTFRGRWKKQRRRSSATIWRLDRDQAAGAGAGAALLAAAGGLRLAGGAGAPGAGSEAGDGGGHAVDVNPLRAFSVYTLAAGKVPYFQDYARVRHCLPMREKFKVQNSTFV